MKQAAIGANRGTNNIQNRLTEEDVLIIFVSERSQSWLAQHYQVSQGAISSIKTGRTWKWLILERFGEDAMKDYLPRRRKKIRTNSPK